MEPILVYGHPLGSSLGLVAAFEWLGRPYRLARVKMPDDMLNDRYARLNGRQETRPRTDRDHGHCPLAGGTRY
jgi:glutathione S-transferase